MCGNHRQSSITRIAAAGSPPRVREPRAGSIREAAEAGITPACAGTTLILPDSITKSEDHPRVCGNHIRCRVFEAFVVGSPPRVREPLHG